MLGGVLIETASGTTGVSLAFDRLRRRSHRDPNTEVRSPARATGPASFVGLVPEAGVEPALGVNRTGF